MKYNQYFDRHSKIHSLFAIHYVISRYNKVTHKTFPTIFSKHSNQNVQNTFDDTIRIEFIATLSTVYSRYVTKRVVVNQKHS